MPVYPGDVIICRRSCPEPVAGLFAEHFLQHGVVFSIHLRKKIGACIREDRQAKMHSDPVIVFRWSRDTLSLFCRVIVSPKSCLCIYRKFTYAIGNCRQANGDNRHLFPDVPAGLGWDFRDMPISCARTHPDADKHVRHVRCTDRYIRDMQTSAP